MTMDALAISREPAPVRSHWDPVLVQQDLSILREFPDRLSRFLSGVPKLLALGSSYREGGWTVTEIVHHLVDSHMHAYMRCKFALCESLPSIQPYDENAWASTPECTLENVFGAMVLLSFLHSRWVELLSKLDEAGWNRAFHHPEHGRDILLFQQVATYAWHGEHHLAQAALALGVALPPVTHDRSAVRADSRRHKGLNSPNI